MLRDFRNTKRLGSKAPAPLLSLVKLRVPGWKARKDVGGSSFDAIIESQQS